MFGWLRRSKPLREQLPTAVLMDGEHVRVMAGEVEIRRFRWDHVEFVFAYKQDCFGVDRIWVAFGLGESECVGVHEEADGYGPLIEEMQRLCTGYRVDWWNAVAFPAFEENLTLVWKRS